MPQHTVILKNTTLSEIQINDLAGMRIPASSQYDASNTRTLEDLLQSDDLLTFLTSGDVILNDGTDDLSLPEATTVMLGLNNEDVEYVYDSARQKLLSITELIYEFGTSGGADNEYLKLMGDISDNDSGYSVRNDCTLIAVVGSSTGGNITKGFNIEVNGTDVDTVNFDSGSILDNTKDIDINAGDRIHVFVVSSGSSTQNPNISLFLKYRK